MKLKLYALAINGNPVCEVSMDVPPELPVRPRLNDAWLQTIAARAIRNFFAPQVYLGRDNERHRAVFN